MSEVVASGIINANALQDWIDTFTPLVSEGKVHFNDDGLTSRVVEPANVAMIRPATLGTGAFEAYDAPGTVTVGVDFNRLDERLKAAGSGTLVELAVDMETRKLSLSFDNINHTVRLIDADAIRQEPDDPDLNLPNTVTLPVAELSKVVTNTDMVSDHLGIDARPGQREVAFVAEGDTDDVELTYGREETSDPTEVTEDTYSHFSLDYFSDLVKAIPKDADVTLTFGDEYPVTVDWSAFDGELEVHQMMAPRIQKD